MADGGYAANREARCGTHKVGIRATGGLVQPPCLDVRFDATVPGVRQVLLKPTGESGQLVGGQLTDCRFKLLEAQGYLRKDGATLTQALVTQATPARNLRSASGTYWVV